MAKQFEMIFECSVNWAAGGGLDRSGPKLRMFDLRKLKGLLELRYKAPGSLRNRSLGFKAFYEAN